MNEERINEAIIDFCPICQTPVTYKQFFLEPADEIAYPCPGCGINLIGQFTCKNCGEAIEHPLPQIPYPFCGIKADSWTLKLQINT